MADALAKGKKPDRTGPKSGEDAFVQSATRAWTWVGENLTTFILLVAGLALVVLGSLYYVNFRASVREQAATELAALRMSGAAPETLIPDLEAYIDRFDGTESANEARIVLGRMYLNSGQPADAIRTLEGVAAPATHPVGFAARSLRAAAEEANGDAEAALATWQALGRDARFGFQRRQASAEAARILAESGRLEEASAILSRIAAEAEAADVPAEAGVYRIRLGEVDARMRAGAEGGDASGGGDGSDGGGDGSDG